MNIVEIREDLDPVLKDLMVIDIKKIQGHQALLYIHHQEVNPRILLHLYFQQNIKKILVHLHPQVFLNLQVKLQIKLIKKKLISKIIM